MSLEVQLVPILDDNYVFLIKNLLTKDAVVVDVGVGVPVLNEVKRQGLRLVGVFITHQHSDHIDGIGEVLSYQKCPVYAPIYNRKDIATADTWLSGGETIELLGEKWEVLHRPSHTKGHLAYYNQRNGLLFSGDLLFGLGVGRLFEGSYEDLWQMLQSFKQLPEETLVYCTHEYTQTNLRFCEFILKEKPQLLSALTPDQFQIYQQKLKHKLEASRASVPLVLGDEFKTNPFFLAQDLQQLTELRVLRNRFS